MTRKKQTVLDPFCGTGTVLLEAVLSGRTALGADANPLAERGMDERDRPCGKPQGVVALRMIEK